MRKIKLFFIALCMINSLSAFRGGAARVTAWNGRHGGNGSTGGFNLSVWGVTGVRAYSPQIRWGGYAHMSKSAYAPDVYNPQESAWCTVDYTSRKR